MRTRWSGLRARRVTPFVCALAAAALLTTSMPARAHQEPYSFLDLTLGSRRIDGRLVAHVVDLAHETGLVDPESLATAAGLARHRADLVSLLERRLDLRADGARITPEWSGVEASPKRHLVAFRWSAALARPAGTIEVRGPLFPYDPTHETYVNVFEAGRLRQQSLTNRAQPATTYYTGSTQGALAVAGTFVLQGIHHIFIGPDHIAFVIGLLLLGGSVLRVLKIVTAFTVAHSVTLVLATLRIVQPPSSLVESAIALSIVAIGIESLFAHHAGRDRRAALAFGFGLVHGFGFASVLREFGLPTASLGVALASFNIGVEGGQACIVLVVTPLLAWVRIHRPREAPRLLAATACLLVLAGAYWFVQRVLAA
jgi:hydrogenase/urease accessory protein HupE